jgi:hypothetical protein
MIFDGGIKREEEEAKEILPSAAKRLSNGIV